ncbi:ADCY2 [Mytilus coruscus]|uniref:ADCY2 n=1 Tax=Mytilus coruscus TaxID=42192 RepID=A0A6J8C045_MYTCO|nr:ADCY2 [Mytilus coruscus]
MYFLKVLASTIKSNSSIQLDFLFYKIFAQFGNPKNLDHCFRGLIAVKYLLQSESSVYIRDVCRRWISNINQHIPQQLPSPVIRKNIENIRSRYHKHLQDALNQDAVTEWLLYASFYYVIGQYNVTLRIVDHVLSKCTPDKIYQGLVFYLQRQINYYDKHVYIKSITLNEKLATISPVRYLQHSSLIPNELKLEIQKGYITIPPVVLSHCLKFLCYYHLGDVFNRQQALRDLYLTVEENCLSKFSKNLYLR